MVRCARLSLTDQLPLTVGVVIWASLKGASRTSSCWYPVWILSSSTDFSMGSDTAMSPYLQSGRCGARSAVSVRPKAVEFGPDSRRLAIFDIMDVLIKLASMQLSGNISRQIVHTHGFLSQRIHLLC